MSKYSSVVLADSPLRYYRLNETSGTVTTDLGSQAQNGTLNGGITLNQASLLKSDPGSAAMLFNGTTGYISLPTTGLPTGTASWSLEAWVKMSTLPGAGVFYELLNFGTGATGSAPQIFITNSLAGMSTWGTALTGGAVSTGVSNHIVGTWDGTTLRLYLNGALTATSTTLNPNVTTLSWSNIGADSNNEDWTNGTISDAAIYSAALSAAQVLAHYNAGTSAVLADTLSGIGQLTGTLSAPLALPTTSLAGSGRIAGTLATPNLFVTQSGGVLSQGGVALRSGGANIYWLGLYQDQSATRFPFFSEIDDALATAVEMGCLFVRSHTLGISVGNPLSIEPSLNTFNDANFIAMDYAIKRAGDFGLKLIIPLTDFNNFYEGGEATFTNWRALSPQTLFYTNATVIADFKAYISHLLNHVNVYTTLAYKNDPAILCWETGNEIYDAPASWTSTIASYIKSIDSNHLVMCGSGLNLTAGAANTANLALSTLDIFTDHFYPPVNSTMTADAASAVAAGKAYLVGEYNWTQFNQAAATFGVDTTTAATGGGTNSAVVNVTSATPGNSGNVQLQQGGLTLVNGSTYTAKFWAKADAARNVDIVVQQGSAPFTVYLQQTIAITTTWTLYTASTFVGVTDTNAFFTFNCSDSTGHIWFDLCSLGTGGGNLLLNPSFESSGTLLTSWSSQVKSGDTLTTFISTIEGNANISGSVFWDLKSHAQAYGYSWSSDPYRMEYPGETADLRTRGQQIRTDSYTLRGLSVPAALVPVGPVLTSVTGAYVVAWQGAVGAYQYDIERSVTSATSGFSVVVSQAITDTQTPWTDPAPPGGAAWYRVKGYSYTGTAGAYSNVLQVGQSLLSLFGSNVAASSPTTAGKSATVSGGTEIAAVTSAPATGNGYVECFALGGVSSVNASLPPPSGKGWIVDSNILDGMRLVAGNWTASVPVSDATSSGAVVSYTIRFWQRLAGGSYAAIGSLVLSTSQVISALRTLKTFPAGAMPQADFAVGDRLYVDFFINANGWVSDLLSVYVSANGAVGVVGDLEVDTAGYLPSGDAGVVTSYIPRALSALLIVPVTALTDTLAGVGTFSGAAPTLTIALACSEPGIDTLGGSLSAALTLPGISCAGTGTLSPSVILTTQFVSTLAGIGTLGATMTSAGGFVAQFSGTGTLVATFSAVTNIARTLAGNGILSPALFANLALPGNTLTGAGQLSGSVGLGTALGTQLAGAGTLSAGGFVLATSLLATVPGMGALSGIGMLSTSPGSTLSGIGAFSGTLSLAAPVTLSPLSLSGIGALNGTIGLTTALTITLVGSGTLSGQPTANFMLVSSTLAGIGALSGTVARTTALALILPGTGQLTGPLSAALGLPVTTLAGVGTLNATITGAGSLVAQLSGIGNLAGGMSAALALGTINLVGTGRFTGTGQYQVILAEALTTPLAGSGTLSAQMGAVVILVSTFAGTGVVAFTLFLKSSFLVTLAGSGGLSPASLSYRAALGLILAGNASLSGTLGSRAAVAYLSATWKTRDGQATWKTRDESVVAWKTRDGQVTWKTRA